MDYKNEAKDITKQAKAYINSTDGWEKHSKSTDNVLIEKKPSDVCSNKMFRFTFKLKCPIETVLKYWQVENSERMEWDNSLEGPAEVLQDFGDDVTLFRVCLKGGRFKITSPREFLTLNYTEKGEDFYTKSLASIDHPDYPVRKGYVRGIHRPCGQMVTKDPGCRAYTQIRQLSHTEMDLPNAIAEPIMLNTFLGIINEFREFLNKNGLLVQ